MAKTVYFAGDNQEYETLEAAREALEETGGDIYKTEKIEFVGSLKPWNYEQDKKEREDTVQYTYPKVFVEHVDA